METGLSHSDEPMSIMSLVIKEELFKMLYLHLAPERMFFISHSYNYQHLQSLS